jgi:IMP dehydrogenase
MSYVGVKSLYEFREQAQFIKVTNAGQTEAHPHLLMKG